MSVDNDVPVREVMSHILTHTLRGIDKVEKNRLDSLYYLFDSLDASPCVEAAPTGKKCNRAQQPTSHIDHPMTIARVKGVIAAHECASSKGQPIFDLPLMCIFMLVPPSLARVCNDCMDPCFQKSITATNSIGCNALHYAGYFGHPKCALVLLQNYAEINCPNFNGWTLLHYAAMHETDDMVKFVVEHGGHLDAVTTKPGVQTCVDVPAGTTPLRLAQLKNKKKVVEFLSTVSSL